MILCMYLLNEINAGLQIKAEVNELPFDPLLLVLFLFEHEHVVVEELLELLVGEVDAQLLKGVHLQPTTIDSVVRVFTTL